MNAAMPTRATTATITHGLADATREVYVASAPVALPSDLATVKALDSAHWEGSMLRRMAHARRTRVGLLLVVCVATASWGGCGLISSIPGVPRVTTNGTVVVTYDGKPVTMDVGKVACTFDGKGSVAFISAGEKTGDTFFGAYSAEGDHAIGLKTAEFPMSLMAANGDEGKDITTATVDKQVYTFAGSLSDMGASASAGKATKKPFKAVVTCA